jgi:hypothetical protein
LDQTQDPRQIKNTDLVILSSTVGSKNLKVGWRQLEIPLMTWESDYIDDLAMTGKKTGTDFGEVEKSRYLWLVNAPHPLAAQLPAGTINAYQKQATMDWFCFPVLQPDKLQKCTRKRGVATLLQEYKSQAPQYNCNGISRPNGIERLGVAYAE